MNIPFQQSLLENGCYKDHENSHNELGKYNANLNTSKWQIIRILWSYITSHFLYPYWNCKNSYLISILTCSMWSSRSKSGGAGSTLCNLGPDLELLNQYLHLYSNIARLQKGCWNIVKVFFPLLKITWNQACNYMKWRVSIRV